MTAEVTTASAEDLLVFYGVGIEIFIITINFCLQ